MIVDQLRGWIEQTLGPWFAGQSTTCPAFLLEEPPAGIDADFACNIAMVLAKPLRKAPRQVAQDIQKILEDSHTPWVESISIAGAGFLNFKLSLGRWHQELETVLADPTAYGRSNDFKDMRVLIEFVSANPTGPLHVGHGRGAALGDSLALIWGHLGAQVEREFYVNDAGNQIQMLGESLLIRCHNKANPNSPKDLPENGYHGDYMLDVADAFLKSKKPDASLEEASQFAMDTLKQKIKEDLEGFGVRFDNWFSEASFVRTGKVDSHIEALRKRGYVKDYEGAIWFVAPGEDDEQKDKDRVLKRKDGRWTYFATDIAYHADKYERGFSKLIDIWGADHHGYVARVKGSMQALGYDPEKLHVLLYQLVSLSRGGVPVSMSKRSGEFVTLKEVVSEVGKDACRFFFAMRGPNTAMDFDLELAKKQSSDNPVYYAQYAHARICSIFRSAGAAATGAASVQLLKEKEERDLIKRLAMFPQALQVCAMEDSPHPLANYVLALCRQFHFFYDHHKVLNQEPALTQARLALLRAVQQLLKQSLALLGVSAPEQM